MAEKLTSREIEEALDALEQQLSGLREYL